MKSKKKKISKLSLKECLQILINEDKNKVAEYFENIKQAALLLSQVKFDCPVINQDMRNKIGDIVDSLDELKTEWIENGYVDRTDLSDVEYNYRYRDRQDSFNTFSLNEEVERYSNIHPHEILNNNFDGSWKDILEAKLFNNYEQCVGSLTTLHYVYDSDKQCLVGSRNSTTKELETYSK